MWKGDSRQWNAFSLAAFPAMRGAARYAMNYGNLFPYQAILGGPCHIEAVHCHQSDFVVSCEHETPGSSNNKET